MPTTITTEATIRTRLTQIVNDLRTAPALTAALLTREYANRHGIAHRVHQIAATLLAEMFDPAARRA